MLIQPTSGDNESLGKTHLLKKKKKKLNEVTYALYYTSLIKQIIIRQHKESKI